MASTKFIPKCRVFANLKRRIHSLAEDGMHIIPNWGQNIECHKKATTTLFLGLRGPHGMLLLVSPSVRPPEKSGSVIYSYICLVNHQKTSETNPMAPRDPLDAPFDPLRSLSRSLDLIELLRPPQLPFKSSVDPSMASFETL